MLFISHIKLNGFESPSLLNYEHPYLSFQLSSDKKNTRQAAYSIDIFSKDGTVYQSGKVDSAQSVHIPLPLSLLPHTDYTLSVSVWSNHGERAEGTTHFHTALAEADFEGAIWITPKTHLTGEGVYFRRKFAIERPVKKAELFYAGLGCSYVYLNGTSLTSTYLDPPSTNYEEMVYYRSLDLTEHIKVGGNALTFEVGEGFYAQSRVWVNYNAYYGPECLRALLSITYQDGSVSHFPTNPEDWYTHASPVTLNSVYGGECFDARRTVEGFADYNGAEEGWQKAITDTTPKGKMVGCDLGGVEIIKHLPAKSVSPCAGEYDGAWIFDMGENMSGVFSATLPPSPAGAIYIFRTAETLTPDGNLDHRSTGAYATQCIQQDIYICKGNPEGEVYTPRFTYHGFRYIELTGFHEFSNGYGTVPPVDMIEGLMLSSKMTETVDFKTDYQPLQHLHELMKNTYRSNFHGYPEDCPAREKCGWLGDAQIVCEWGLYAYDSTPFYEKFLLDIATTKKIYGKWHMIAPGRRDCDEASSLWGCAQVLIPYWLWQYQNNTTAIKTHLPLMHEWVAHELAQAKEYIISEGLGDWLPPCGNNSPKRMPVAHSSTFMLYEIAHRMAEICHVFETEKEAYYTHLADEVKQAIIDHFYLPDQHSYGYWGSDGVALTLHLYPEGEHDALQNALKERMQADDFAMPTGIYGNKYLVPALFDAGLGDMALAYLFHPTHASFATMMAEGATSIWERLEMRITEPDKSLRVASHNHPMHGGFLSSCFTHMAGIRPMSPGFATFSVNPCFTKHIHNLSMAYESPYGTISFDYHIGENGVVCHLTVPANATAVLTFKEGKCHKIDGTPLNLGQNIGSGTYEITFDMN